MQIHNNQQDLMMEIALEEIKIRRKKNEFHLPNT